MIPLGVSGAYSVVDRNSNFILGRADFVEIYRDSVAGDRSSPIELAKRVFLPASAFCRASDLLVGGVMLPDGHLAFVTQQAAVGVIPSDEADMDAANVVSLPSENGAACDDTSIPDGDLETVSNSIAADEYGGIYVVTNKAVIKYQWDGAALSKVWRTAYESDPPFSVLRLGPGSGSTPSLMGTALDDDHFVVITDGRELMHLVLLWRDEIPADWQPIAPGVDPRIACEVPVTFGDPNATRTLSEQSVLVRGYASVVVNNLLSDESNIQSPIPALATALAALEGGNPAVAPHGVERIDWDPQTRTCHTVWANPTISLPNGIPTMSEATGLMYGIGQREGSWGLEALDFASGASRFFVPSAQTTCSQIVLDQVAASILGPILSPVLQRLPASCENSIFAATEVGPDGTIYTGTFQGASRFVPDSVVSLAARRQAQAGVGQGDDLANRGLAALTADVERARDAIQRGQAQLDATRDAIAAAAAAGELDGSSEAGADARTASARAHFAAAEAALDADATLSAGELGEARADLAAAQDWLTPCPPAPQTGCRVAALSTLRIATSAGMTRIAWRWEGADDSAAATLPDPTRDAEYALCLYGGDGGVRAGQLVIPPDPYRWRRRRRADGLIYRSEESSQAARVLIRESGGSARIRITARGTGLTTPSLPASTPLVAQLVNGDSDLCWGAVFDGARIKRNDSTTLKAASR